MQSESAALLGAVENTSPVMVLSSLCFNLEVVMHLICTLQSKHSITRLNYSMPTYCLELFRAN
jgi:hypothetical protein